MQALAETIGGPARARVRRELEGIDDFESPAGGALGIGAEIDGLVMSKAAWDKGHDTSPKAATLELPLKAAAFRTQVTVT